MKTDTELKLKQLLAKMLPEKLTYGRVLTCFDEDKGYTRPVLDTELLHLCWLVEEGLTEDEMDADCIKRLTYHATWQQRVQALAKVKGLV